MFQFICQSCPKRKERPSKCAGKAWQGGVETPEACPSNPILHDLQVQGAQKVLPRTSPW